MSVNRCYRGCPERKLDVWVRCPKCKKIEAAREAKSGNWLLWQQFKMKMADENA